MRQSLYNRLVCSEEGVRDRSALELPVVLTKRSNKKLAQGRRQMRSLPEYFYKQLSATLDFVIPDSLDKSCMHGLCLVRLDLPKLDYVKFFSKKIGRITLL